MSDESLPEWYVRVLAAACDADPERVRALSPADWSRIYGGDPTAADRLADATGRDRDVFAADDLPLPAVDDLETVSDATEALAAREERELRGAWRAEYDRVDVYDEAPEFGSGVGQITLGRRYVPRHAGEDRRDPSGWRYAFSYDLDSVPDDVILEAIREDL